MKVISTGLGGVKRDEISGVKYVYYMLFYVLIFKMWM